MSEYKKGKKLLTQKALKEAAKNKTFVWVVSKLPDPSDRLKEMNEALVPEATADNDGFYLGNTCWDNVDNDNENCFSDGFDGDILSIYEAIEKEQYRYLQSMTTNQITKAFLEEIPEEVISLLEEINKMQDFKDELQKMIVDISD